MDSELIGTITIQEDTAKADSVLIRARVLEHPETQTSVLDKITTIKDLMDRKADLEATTATIIIWVRTSLCIPPNVNTGSNHGTNSYASSHSSSNSHGANSQANSYATAGSGSYGR